MAERTERTERTQQRYQKSTGNIGRFFGLVTKNLKNSVRDKGNYFWVIGYPVLFIIIYGLAFNAGGITERSTYSVVFFNEDTIGANNALEQNVSLTFLNLFNSSDPENELTKTFIQKTTFENGSIITKEEALAMVNKGEIDAVIIIPKNFSEVVIGSTWWYKIMKSDDFQSMPPEAQAGFQQELPQEWIDSINSTAFPSNGSPSLEIHCIPDLVTKAVISNVFDGIMNDIVLGYNAVSPVDTKITEAGSIQAISIFDWAAPGILIGGVTVAIMMVANNFGIEKDKGLIRRLDTTPVPRSTQLLAGGFAQLIFSSIQIVILLIMLKIFGVQTAPNINWGLAFLNALIMALPCIGIGLIIAAIVKNGSEAGGVAWIAILPLQFLGGVFFDMGEGIGKYIPTFYGSRAMRNIMVYGAGFMDVWPDLLTNILFGIGFIVIGLIVFHKKSQA